MADQLKVLIMGVGGAGKNMINILSKKNMKGVSFALVNTKNKNFDTNNNKSSKVLVDASIAHKKENSFSKVQLTSNKILEDSATPSFGAKAVIADKKNIESMISGYDLIFLCAGLGGNTGSGATPVIAQMIHKNNTPVIFIGTMPFNLEKKRIPIAETASLKLKAVCDNVLILSNNRLLELFPDKSLLEAFEFIEDRTAAAISGFISVYSSMLPLTEYSSNKK